MRKCTIFGIVMLLLISLMSLMPVVKAASSSYIWDNLNFVEGYEGGWINYPHPDRLYYDISPYNTNGIDGKRLHHCQVDAATSSLLVGSVDILATALGAYIGYKIGGLFGAVAGGIIGKALGIFIQYVADTYFFDENGCIWWWVSLGFINWCINNAYTLWCQGIANPTYAITLVVTTLLATGYLRIGDITFLDAIGVGNPEPFQYLTISRTGGEGTTNPSYGTYAYSYGEVVTVTAIPDENYYLRWWVLDGTWFEYQNPITVTMDRKHTLQAYFKLLGYGGGGCPILSVYDGEEYVEEGSLNIHAPEGEDIIVSHTLTVEPEPEGPSYLLRLTEPDLPDGHSFIDQVKLLAVDELGNTKKLQLINAVHSEYGNVLWKLLFSDDARTDTLPYQTIDLKFLAPIWESEVEELVFVIEGYNTKRPW